MSSTNPENSNHESRKYFTTRQLTKRMKRASIRAWGLALTYGAKMPPIPPFYSGEENTSIYRSLSKYADELLKEFGDWTDESVPKTDRVKEGQRLTRAIYIYCSSAARIVVRAIRMRIEQIRIEKDG